MCGIEVIPRSNVASHGKPSAATLVPDAVLGASYIEQHR
jgi:hypothetical protein